MPVTKTEYVKSKKEIIVKYTTDTQPEKVIAWFAESKTRDFRESKWKPVEMAGTSKSFSCKIPKQKGKNLAIIIETHYKTKNNKYILSERVKIFY